jgi:lambda family phage minor tail protein L
MTTNAKIASDMQQPDVGEMVVLYVLDLSPLGGGTLRFTENTTISGSTRTAVKFQGVTYFPLDIESEGWDVSGEGTLPRPKIRYNNTEITLQAYINQYDDLIGALIYRKRTFSKYLDGAVYADSAAEFPTDCYRIERKTSQNKNFVEFELASELDLEGKKVPARLVLRDTCTHSYRIYSGGSFDYTHATCPYTGTDYFKIDGTSTTIANDKCGKRLSDCELRYGTEPLPYRGFPGAGLIR